MKKIFKILFSSSVIFSLLYVTPSWGNSDDNWTTGLSAYENKDYPKALRKFQDVVNANDPANGLGGALSYLGDMYLNGQGTRANPAEAAKFYLLAADDKVWFSHMQDTTHSKYQLGWMYKNGIGVLQDYAVAVKWYRLAAQGWHSEAQHNLASMYSRGQGVAQDLVRAHMWSNVAATAGDDLSVKLRAQLTSIMTQEQIAAAQSMAKDCLQRGFKGCE